MANTSAASDSLLRVLIADDFEPGRFILHQQLVRNACLVEEASDGAQALALWRRSLHPLVLTDLRMPQLDGFELSRRIRDEERATGTRSFIVGVSAGEGPSERAAAVAAGMDELLAKPLSLPALLALLQSGRAAAQLSISLGSGVGHGRPTKR